jgi:mRNA-degrading endonuclease YafQ of YafQ-DinJ toxin-antitoxin module
MLRFRTAGEFKKDFRRVQKRGNDLQKLKDVMNMLVK